MKIKLNQKEKAKLSRAINDLSYINVIEGDIRIKVMEIDLVVNDLIELQSNIKEQIKKNVL